MSVYVLTEAYCDNPDDDESGSSVEDPICHLAVFADQVAAITAAEGRVAALEDIEDIDTAEVHRYDPSPSTPFRAQVTLSYQVYFVEVKRHEVA